MTGAEQLEVETTPVVDEDAAYELKQDLLFLFDAACRVHTTVTIFERENPGAVEVLLLWAHSREEPVIETQHPVSKHCPVPFETVRVQFAHGHEICVYRLERA